MSYSSPKWNNESAPPLSAENMQALTDAVQEQGETLETMCNPNMLDNWHFVNPVNQRGQTSYTGAVYGVDRWRGSAADIAVAVATGGISVSGKQFQRLEQRLEYAQNLNGVTVTFSALVKNPNGKFRLNLYNSTTDVSITQDIQASEDFQLVQITAAPVINAGDVFSVALYPGANDATTERTCTIKAVKLELGSQQTLAHQENGVWALNEIPNYGEQLRRCQRYFQVIRPYNEDYNGKYATFAPGTADSATVAPIYLIGRPSMRTKPVITTTGNFRVRYSGGNKAVTNLNLAAQEWTSEMFIMNATVSGGLTPGAGVTLQADNDDTANIFLSAEL